MTTFELVLPPRDPGPAYRWLYSALRTEILRGHLRPGARLPATRDLAGQYGLARGTIVNAFEQLKSEGYVEGSVGSGTFVSKVLPEELLHVRGAADERRAQGPPRRNLAAYGSRVRLLPNLELRPTRAFRCNLPALDLFPATLWAQVTAGRWRRASTNLLMGCGAMGYPPLCEIVAGYLRTARGAVCTADQVMIVSGVQEALDLVARLFLDPGDQVCMEDPGYPGAASVFETVGARISGVPVDAEGFQLPPRSSRPRLIYITPGHQFPLGMTMSLPRRLALLEWARRFRTLIFEDDYDSEYRYAGHPVPVLQGLDRNGVVLLAGSFSKTLFPSLRLGYLVVPQDLVPYFAATKSLSSRHAQLLDQAVLCDFIAEGHYGRHLRRMREVYSERLSVLLEGAREKLGGLLDISQIQAGLQTVGWLCDAVKEEEVANRAAARNVEVTPLSPYYRRPVGKQGLQLGFSAVDTREIRRGIQQLAAVLEGLRRERSGTA